MNLSNKSASDLVDLPGRLLVAALSAKIKRRIGLLFGSSKSTPVAAPLSIELSEPLTIADIGASGGIHPRWNGLVEQIRAILVEPDPREIPNLQARIGPRDIVLGTALSDRAGSIDFYLCRKQTVSSVYRPNTSFLKRFPDPERFEILETSQMTAETLDGALSKQGIARVDFIKLDTQGHELAILKGADSLLEHTLGLEIEVEFAPMYSDQPLFPEVHAFAASKGFQLFDLRRHYWARETGEKPTSTRGQLIYGDALYFRPPEHVAASGDRETILRAYVVYLAYGYADLALSLIAEAGEVFTASQAQDLKREALSFSALSPHDEGPWHSDAEFGNR